MKLWPFRREKALTASPGVVDALRNQAWSPYPLLGGGSRQRISDVYSTAQTAGYTWMYTNSPAVRTVIDCIRRNVGQLDLRLFEELEEGDREPRPEHPAALSMRYPNETTPSDQFIRSLFLDFLVHDNAYALLVPAAGRQLNMWWLPAFRMELSGESIFDAENYRYHNPQNGTFTDFSPDQILHWRGENPHDQRLGLSLLETLRKVVAEDAALQQANVELANSGMQKPVWVFRPLEAPEWSPEARSRAEEDLRNRLRKSTDMPAVLEEGMELRDFGVSPNDAEALDVRKWLLAEVAQAYGVPGPMVGLDGDLEKATASFYADTLPPYCEQFTRALNHLLLVRKYSDTDLTFEFNLAEKQAGDERVKTLIAMAGGPIQTRNESRADLDLPAVPGGDELLTPANYQVGAKPKPTTTVMPVQDPNRPAQDGSARSDDLPTPQPAAGKQLEDQVQAVLERTYGRQRRAYQEKGMFERDRFSRELTNDLVVVAPGLDRGALVARVDGICDALAHAVQVGDSEVVFARAVATAPQLAKTLVTVLGMDLHALRSLGVPAEIVWERAGFLPAEIDRMRAMQIAGELTGADEPG